MFVMENSPRNKKTTTMVKWPRQQNYEHMTYPNKLDIEKHNENEDYALLFS